MAGFGLDRTRSQILMGFCELFPKKFLKKRLELVKRIRQQSLQKGKDAHHDCDFQPVLFGGKFEARLLIAESADIVMDEILEQVDYKVGEERDNNQVNTGTVHTLCALF
jgi:hypothetical protein